MLERKAAKRKPNLVIDTDLPDETRASCDNRFAGHSKNIPEAIDGLCNQPPNSDEKPQQEIYNAKGGKKELKQKRGNADKTSYDN